MSKNLGEFKLPDGLVMPIFFAPSGAGKSTIVKFLIEKIPELSLSVSDATRDKRSDEIDGVHYYFRKEEEFKNLIDAGAFLEYEEVYPGKFYGTRFAEIARLYGQGKVPFFDIDVDGAKNLSNKYPKHFVPIMVHTNIDDLRIRLVERGKDTIENINIRMNKAEAEYGKGLSFVGGKNIVYNNVLEEAQHKALQIVREILKQ